jgi:Zn-dependent protease
MKGSLRIARFFGIPVELHWTFIFVLIGAVYWGLNRGGGWVSALWFLALVASLFLCVLLHEFGHALTARRFGVTTKDIILSPIGGIARLSKLPEHPFQELLVAAAGPLVNIVIAILLSPYYFLSSSQKQMQLLGSIMPSSNVFVHSLSLMDRLVFFVLFLNIILAVFNLLPAFPMDGGRILRALLSTQLSRRQATRVSMYIGQAMALALIFMGLTQMEIGSVKMSFMIAFIGLFVFISASNENRYVRFSHLLEQASVDKLLRRELSPMYSDTPMEVVVETYAEGKEKNFVVFNKWHNIIGLLTEEKIRAALKKKDFGAAVREYMLPYPAPLVKEDSAKSAMDRMQESELSILPVFEKGKFIGLVDYPALNQYLKEADQSRNWLWRS